ncbi:hypothetical protein BJX64DRAFT_285770 [Aspergillus heterothallicus]
MSRPARVLVPPFWFYIREMQELNSALAQPNEYILYAKEESPLGTTVAIIMSILNVKYRVDIETNEEDNVSLDVGDRTVGHHFLSGMEICYFLLDTFDVKHKISYPKGTYWDDTVNIRVEKLTNAMNRCGDDVGAFVSALWGLLESEKQWLVHRKVTLPDMLLFPYVYNIYGKLHTSAICDAIDDWIDRMQFKPGVRKGMSAVGFVIEQDEYYEEMAEEWIPRSRPSRPARRSIQSRPAETHSAATAAADDDSEEETAEE